MSPVRPPLLRRHTVLIRAWLAPTAHGDQLADPVETVGRVHRKHRVVTTSTGDEVVSDTTVYLAPGTLCPAESLVRLAGEDTWRRAVTVTDNDGAWTPQTRNLEIALT